ncbi:MAG: SCO family protein [Elusimicrobiota bacterium]
MMRKGFFYLALALPMIGACRAKPSAPASVYSGQGVIQEIHPKRQELVIAADAIPGFMDAMTMPYPVAAPDILKGLKPGGAIAFKIRVAADGTALIESITKSPPAENEPAAAAAPDNAALIHIPKAGEKPPRAAFTDQNGRRFRLSAARGKIVILDFIYAACPFPDYCPRSMAQMREIQTILGSAIGTKAILAIVTFDPLHDSPSTLKRYAAKHGASGAGWKFLTGRPKTVEKFVSFFDVNYWTGPNGRITRHSLSAALLGPDGAVAKFYAGNDWTGAQIAADAKSLLEKSAGAGR